MLLDWKRVEGVEGSADPGQGGCRAGNGLAKVPCLCRLSGGAEQRGNSSGRWGRSSHFCRQAEQTEPSYVAVMGGTGRGKSCK